MQTIWSNVWPSSPTCSIASRWRSRFCKPIFLLKIARMAQAGFADVDCRHLSVRLAQRMDGSLRRSAAGDQDLSICPRLLRWPQQKGQCPTPIRVPIELAMPIEVVDRRRIRVALVKSAHLVGWIGGRRCSRLLRSHMRLFAPFLHRPLSNRIGRPPENPTAAPDPVRPGYVWVASCILRSTSSRLKLAAFWRCGYSLKVCRNSPTKACAGTIR